MVSSSLEVEEVAPQEAGYSSDSSYGRHPAEALIIEKARRRDNAELRYESSSMLATLSAGEEQLGMEDGQPEAPPGLESLDPIYLYGGDKQLAASGVGEFMLGKVSSKKTSRKGKRARKRVLEEADLEGNAVAGGRNLFAKQRTEEEDIDAVSLLSSDSEEERGITLGNAPNEPGKAAAALPAPTGVTVVADGQEPLGRAPEMQRLLRQPRYFDEDFEAAAMRCFKCGGQGHRARECPNEERQRPCFLCGQFGHTRAQCSNMICFKCNKPGHLAKDCPNGYAAAVAATVCLRCGRQDCAAAGAPDFIRAEGGCTGDYLEEDLQQARCAVCWRRGHLSCQLAEGLPPQRPSCYNCGENGHLAEECWRERPQAVQNERRAYGSRRLTAVPRGGAGVLEHSYYTAAASSRTSWDAYGAEDLRTDNEYGGQRMGNTYGGFGGNGFQQRGSTGYSGGSSAADRLARFAAASKMDVTQRPSYDYQQQQKQSRQQTVYIDRRERWQVSQDGDNADWRKYGSTRKKR